MSIEEYAALTRPSVLAVYQAMLPLLRQVPRARIVNVSSGLGSVTLNRTRPSPTARSSPRLSCFQDWSQRVTVAMAIELESTGIKVNAVSPGFTRTNLNNYPGTETVEQDAREAVRVALLGPDGPTGAFTHATLGTIPW